MLFSKKQPGVDLGDVVYIGHTASLSYLGFVRHVVKTSMGPSSFTENEFNNFMLEIEPSAANVAPASLASLDIEQKRLLIESYNEAVCVRKACSWAAC